MNSCAGGGVGDGGSNGVKREEDCAHMDTLICLHDHLKQLLDAKLYKSVDLFISYCHNKLASQPLYHMFLALHAEALHKMKQYEKAELTYKKALQFNKGSNQCLFPKCEQVAVPTTTTDHHIWTTSSSQLQENNQSAANMNTVSTGANKPTSTISSSSSSSLQQNNFTIPSDHHTNQNNQSFLSKPTSTSAPLFLNTDFYFKLAKTQVARKNFSAAIQSLLTIPLESRTLKVQAMLLQVVSQQHPSGALNSTISKIEIVNDLKGFLKQWPLSLSLIAMVFKDMRPVSPEVVKELCSLVENALVNLNLNSVYTEWVPDWIRLCAMEYIVPHDKYCSQLEQTASSIQKLLGSTPPFLSASIAVCQYNAGQYEHARRNFTEARRKDPHLTKGMAKYCELLSMVRNVHMLDVVATRLMSIDPESPEALVALGYYCLSSAQSVKNSSESSASNAAITSHNQNKLSRVLYIAHKALMVDGHNVEALILKAKALSSKEINRIDDAIFHYREALRNKSWCFEAHSGVVECLLSRITALPSNTVAGVKDQQPLARTQALVSAFNAVKICGKNARTLTLLASVLRVDPTSCKNTKQKLQVTLNKALECDPRYAPAILLKAEVLLQAGKLAAQQSSNQQSTSSITNSGNIAAIKWLMSNHDLSPEAAIPIHEKVASIYSSMDRKDEELIHRNAVLSLIRLANDGSEFTGATFPGSQDDLGALDAVTSGGAASYVDFSIEMANDDGTGLGGSHGGSRWHSTIGSSNDNVDMAF